MTFGWIMQVRPRNIETVGNMSVSDLTAAVRGMFKYRKIVFSRRIAPALILAVAAIGLLNLYRTVHSEYSVILIIAACVFCGFSIFWLLSNVLLLPWEKRRIASIRRSLDKMEYREARKLLDKASTGFRKLLMPPGRIELDLLWADYHTYSKHNNIATHEALGRANIRVLFPWEERDVTIRWLQLYWLTGTHDSFRRLLKKAETLIAEHNSYPTIRAWEAEIDGDFQTARKVLEESVSRKANTKSINVARLINLGRISLIMGNRTQAGDFFRQAADTFDTSGTPYLYDTVYHNLLILLLQDGRNDEAIKTINEYRKRVDWANPYMVLGYMNTVVDAARQIKDAPLLLSAYALVDVYVKPKLSREEFLAQMISELRSRSNDNQSFLEHVMRIHSAFPELLELPFPHRYMALTEIVGSLRTLAENGNLGPASHMFYTSVKKLVDSIELIDRQRRDVPADLMSDKWHWISARINVMKYRAHLEQKWTGDFFTELFNTLSDLIDVAESAENRYYLIYSMVMLVDEYASYEIQLGSDFPGGSWRSKAEEVLGVAERICLQNEKDRGLIVFTLGLAWGYYRLMGDSYRARFWIDKFKESGQSIYHYASWWRWKYIEVKNWVNNTHKQ